jgi:adenylate cyclase
VAISAAASLVGLAGFSAGVLGGLEHQAEDLLQPGAEASGDVVVVAIDRSTLARTGGTWPMSRAEHAALVDAIGRGGPAVVLYDVLFADRADGDGALAAALARTPTVLASALTLHLSGDGPARVVDRIEPHEALAAASAGVAHANVRVNERAGVVRSIPFYAAGDRGVPVPSLALAGTQAFDSVPRVVTERRGGVQLGERFVPLDDGELRINWSGELTNDDLVSAAAVLAGEVDPRVFSGKVVLVGLTEPTLGDLHLTPLDRSGSTPGVLVHANAINTVLGSAYLTDVSAARVALLLAGLTTVTAAAFVWLRLRWALLVAAAATVAVIAWSSWRFHAAGALWPILWPILVVALAAALGTLWRYLAEHRHRRRAQELFARYVPDAVVAELADARTLDRAAMPREVEVAVLFCDLRGFTPVAGALQPAQVRGLLDAFYDYAVGIVHEHGGTVMQFVGDEVYAVFGAPLSDDHRCAHALDAACALVDRVGELDARLAAEGLPPVRYGVGVNEGPAVAAHLGPATRRQYNVIGDTVNVGSRLCSAAAAGCVVASPWVVERAGDHRLAPAEVVELKGVAAAIRLHRYDAAGSGASERRTSGT